jgi:predicted dehydrogenase
MSERVRTGVVGTGYLGRLHARVLTEMPEVEVVGFVEPNDATAAEVEANLKIPRVGSVAELAGRVQCAVVATPTTHHFEVADELLRAGCDVMIEKPIAATADEAGRLIERAGRGGRIIQIGHVERYNPAVTAIASMVESPRYIETDRLGVFSPRSLDIDVLLDLMIHDINLVLSFTGGARVVDVRAVGVPVLTEKVDIANVRIEFEDGAVANLTASRVSSERVRKVRIFGGDYYFSVDTKDQEVKGFRLEAAGGGKKIEPIEIEVKKKEPLRAELESFIESVTTRRPPLVGGEDGLAALALALRVGREIERSLATGDVRR